MSKQNLMKSVIAMVMTGFILFSCQKDEKKIVGVWKVDTIEIKELKYSDSEHEAQMRQYVAGISATTDRMGTIEFTKDGKVILNTIEKGTYTLDNGKLVVLVGGGSMFGTIDCSFPKKNTMYWDIDQLEDEGERAVYAEEGVTKYVWRWTLKKQ